MLRIILAATILLGGAALICWLWIRAFTEKKSGEPQRAAAAGASHEHRDYRH